MRRLLRALVALCAWVGNCLGSMFCPEPRRFSPTLPPRRFPTAEDGIAADWRAVGGDLRRAMRKWEEENGVPK